MTDSWTDTELALALTDLGARIALPDFSLVTRVHAEIESTRQPRRVARRSLLVAAVVVVLVVVLATAAIAPARDAVARVVGIGTTTVEQVDSLPEAEPADRPTGGGSTRSLVRQLRAAGGFVPSAALVGAPTGWEIEPTTATVAYPSVVLAQVREGDAAPVNKLTPRTAESEFVSIGGVTGLWVPGPHVREVDGRRFESASALIWVDHGVQFRLEGDLPQAQMRAIARSLRAA